ncbi:MAG: hypothetical protein VX733_15270 [Candidatus Latescibacterota bacterium]|nr:hypothetical protein [Candidatus Latescibacterota bacterium]
MRTTIKLILAVAVGMCVGCLTPPPQLKYVVKAKPEIRGASASYAHDPADSSVVWEEEGLEIRVRHLDDDQLDSRFDPKVSPYTLGDWKDPDLGYRPPLWTALEVTVINRTRERVELDPTQAILRLADGRYFFCSQGVGKYVDAEHYYDYSYLKWSADAGNVEFYRQNDRADILNRTQYLREKPIRKGRKYVGILTFPRLPEDAVDFTLEVNNFILAFDRFEVGYGNPVEFIDLKFPFKVEQSVVEVSSTAGSGR